MLSRKLKSFVNQHKPGSRRQVAQPTPDSHDSSLSFAVSGTRRPSLYAPNLSLSHLNPRPFLLKSFRRLSTRSDATSATAVTDITAATDRTNTTDVSYTTAVARDGTNVPNANVVRVGTAPDDIKVAEDELVQAHIFHSMPAVQYLTALDLSVLEFSPPISLPALYVPSDDELFIASLERDFRRPKRFRASLFDVLPMWTSHPVDDVDGDPHPIDDVDSEPEPEPKRRRPAFVLPRTPRAAERAPLIQPKGGGARVLRAWGRRRITARPELEGAFPPFLQNCGPATDVFGHIAWVPHSPRAHTLSRPPAAGHAAGYATPVHPVVDGQPKGAYMLPTPRIYPKESCFARGDTCPCLPTLLSHAKTPSTEGRNASELTLYLAELANELREIVACSPRGSVHGSEGAEGPAFSSSCAASVSRISELCRRLVASTEDVSDLSVDNAGGWGPLLPPISLLPSSNGGWGTPRSSMPSELMLSPSLEVSLTSIAGQLQGFSPA